MQSQEFSPSKTYRVVSQKIVWESFDDELVVINLDSGKYYSLNCAAGVIWRTMEAERTPSETIQWLFAGSGTPESASQILEFWKNLVDEGLIAEIPEPNAPQPASEIPPPPQSWVPPAMTAYSDMSDLFILDPIHDVDEAGWPSRSPQAS